MAQGTPSNPFRLRKLEERITFLENKMTKMREEVDVTMKKFNDLWTLVTNTTIPINISVLLGLPDHLRLTLMQVALIGRATAEEVAERTKRARAVESAYLNQLVIMKYLKKERAGRKAYFCLVSRDGML